MLGGATRHMLPHLPGVPPPSSKQALSYGTDEPGWILNLSVLLPSANAHNAQRATYANSK